jgi:Cu(I)/Ag(I) efflux system membrane fusion protein
MRYCLILAVILALGACQGKKKAPAGTAATAARSDVYYTCSMHPQVMQDGPGKCPICGMELIPVKKGTGQAEGNLVLSDQQVQLGGIRVDSLAGGPMGDRVTLTATVNVDESLSRSVNARVAGRIEKLYYKNTGDYVHTGDRLFDLYREELNNAKQEYVLALERQRTLDNGLIDFKQLVEAAKTKLLLWGMSEQQVQELARARQVSAMTPFYSPASGTILSVEAREGDYLGQGAAIVRLADLSMVWVEAQVYTAQLSTLDRNAKALVRLPDLPGREWTGKISFVNPEISADTRINLVRIVLPNPGGLLRPGMPAYVTLVNRESHSLSLPVGAVIRGGGGAVVWVQVGHNTYRSVMVETGLEDGDRVEIRSGLKAGDVVVTAGAYLLNSEYVFRHGTDPMAGMDMKNR